MRNEALEGDLLEEFHQGRAASWYWRQVLRAMLWSFSAPLRTVWAVVWTVVFPIVWRTGMNELTRLTVLSPPMLALNNWLRHQGAYGFVLATAGFITLDIAVPLAVYLALTRKLTRRTFTVGLFAGSAGAGVMLFILMNYILFLQPLFRLMNTPMNYLLAYARLEHWNLKRWLGMYEMWRWSLPLLAAICATKIKISILRRLPGALATAIRNVVLGTFWQAPCE
jgi:hypothetical protein